MERATVAIKLLKSSGFRDYGYTSSFVFASVSSSLSQVSYPSTCRGEQISGISSSIREVEGYYCQIEPGSIGLDKVRLIAMSKSLEDEAVYLIEDFLHTIERTMGLEPSVIKRVSNLKNLNAFYFEGDSNWMSPPMLSLYALLIRNVYKVHLGTRRTWRETIEFMKEQQKEFFQTNSNCDFFFKLMKYGPKALFGEDCREHYIQGPSARDFHNYGIEYTAQCNLQQVHDGFKPLIQRVHDRISRLEGNSIYKIRRKTPIATDLTEYILK